MKRLLDTNAVLYLLQGRVSIPFDDAEYLVSVVTEMELLCFPGISEGEEARIKAFLSDVSVVGITDEVKDAAIRLRRHNRLPLPDAIICATALVLDAAIVSNDEQIAKIPGITCIPVKLDRV